MIHWYEVSIEGLDRGCADGATASDAKQHPPTPPQIESGSARSGSLPTLRCRRGRRYTSKSSFACSDSGGHNGLSHVHYLPQLFLGCSAGTLARTLWGIAPLEVSTTSYHDTIGPDELDGMHRPLLHVPKLDVKSNLRESCHEAPDAAVAVHSFLCPSAVA